MPKARRGEIWLVDLGMVAKNRPAVVLSVEYLDHERAVVTYAPGFDAGAFDAQGIGGVPDVRLVRRLGMAPASTLAEIERAVKAWLALP
jgi:mRNA interferase MazF